MSGGSGTSYSRSVSQPAPDELQLIDTGRLIVTSSRIAFAGQHFTRNAAGGKIISVEFDMPAGIASISTQSSTKSWHVANVSPVGLACLPLVELMSTEQSDLANAPKAWIKGFTRNPGALDPHRYDMVETAIADYSALASKYGWI